MSAVSISSLGILRGIHHSIAVRGAKGDSMRLLLVALAILSADSTSAQSVFSAKSLMELNEGDASLFVMGWLAGYDSAKLISTYTVEAEATKLRACVPPNTNGKIAYAVVQAHYNRLKETRSTAGSSSWDQASWLPAGMFIHSALANYWPCKP
jgi:hypothetical protein